MLPKGRAGLVLLLSVAMLASARAGLLPVPGLLPVVSDWRTGLALHGFDPVAYFADGRPVPGAAELELSFGGAVWRFRNVGNRAAFAADPQAYAPRFGGHDPIALSRGVALPGTPKVWAIVHGHLYLFHAPATRDAFRAEPRKVVAAAAGHWPALADAIENGARAPGIRAVSAGGEQRWHPPTQ